MYEGGGCGSFGQTVGKVYVLERDFETFVETSKFEKEGFFYAEIACPEHPSGFVSGAPLGPSFSRAVWENTAFEGTERGIGLDRGGVCRKVAGLGDAVVVDENDPFTLSSRHARVTVSRRAILFALSPRNLRELLFHKNPTKVGA